LPDDDREIVLGEGFAQIELAAALAGLPPLGGRSIRQAPFDSAQGGPRRATIRA